MYNSSTNGIQILAHSLFYFHSTWLYNHTDIQTTYRIGVYLYIVKQCSTFWKPVSFLLSVGVSYTVNEQTWNYSVLQQFEGMELQMKSINLIPWIGAHQIHPWMYAFFDTVASGMSLMNNIYQGQWTEESNTSCYGLYRVNSQTGRVGIDFNCLIEKHGQRMHLNKSPAAAFHMIIVALLKISSNQHNQTSKSKIK